MAVGDIGLGVILFVAFAPSLLYLVRIRNIERFNRNPMTTMLLIFTWGAVAAIAIAVVLEGALNVSFDRLRPSSLPSETWLAVVLAPLAEEPAKVAGLFLLRRTRLLEEEDGLVYGAAAGLGFAATENLAYELAALVTHDFSAWVATAVMRTLTSTLLHASSSAMAGWGLAKARVGGQGPGVFVPYLLLAMLMHGSFNLLASLTLLSANEFSATLISLLFVLVFARIVYGYTRAKIRELDRKSARARVI